MYPCVYSVSPSSSSRHISSEGIGFTPTPTSTEAELDSVRCTPQDVVANQHKGKTWLTMHCPHPRVIIEIWRQKRKSKNNVYCRCDKSIYNYLNFNYLKCIQHNTLMDNVYLLNFSLCVPETIIYVINLFFRLFSTEIKTTYEALLY